MRKLLNIVKVNVILLFLLLAACGGSGAEGGIPGSIDGTWLSPPDVVTASAGDKEISITWSDVEDADTYEVWYSTVDNTLTPAPLRSGTDIAGTSHIIKPLPNGVVYYVWIKAKNDEETSGFSISANGMPGIFVPVVTTMDIKTDKRNREQFISGTTAVGAGNVISQGLSPVIERGLCWSTSENPTVSDSKSSNGAGTGGFPCSLTGLTEGTLYYVRAYAVNSSGIGYGNQISFNSGRVLGSTYQGGLVFYNDGYGSGLAAAPEDQSAGIRWYNGTFTATGATGTVIGTGAANTAAIIASQGIGAYAANACKGTLFGYSDWFLPSKDELHLININLGYASHGFHDSYYWSSSESAPAGAWCQTFNAERYQTTGNKSFTARVRAIRAFDNY